MMERVVEDQFFLEKCTHSIEEKLNFGKCENWSTHDFEQVSYQISEVSKISISVKTIKRLFGRIKYKDSYNPQPETKKALAIFLGYASWEDFKRNVGREDVIDSIPEVIPVVINTDIKPVKGDNFFSYRKIIFFISIVIISTLAVIVINHYRHKKNLAAVVFKIKYAKGVVPHTAAFEYDVSSIKSDSVFIDFGNDKKQLLDKNKRFITNTYFLPDFYEAKIKVDKQVISTLNVHALSNGWQILYHNADFQRRINLSAKTPGMLAASSKDILFDTIKSYRVKFRNVADFDANTNNFSLVTRASTNTKQGVDCHRITIRISGEKGFYLINVVQKGCFKQVKLVFGDLRISGEDQDMSTFQTDFSGWQTIKFTVQRKKAYIYLQNKLIYQQPYSPSLGKIKGIHYTFSNNGAVDYVRLYNENNQLVYNEDFN